MTRQIKPIGATLAPLRWAIVNPIKARLRQHGINYPFEQLIIMKAIRDHNGPLVQQDIAEMMGKNKSVILRMVDALKNEGFIHRVVDKNDRRRNILSLTDTGNQLIERFVEIEKQVSVDLMDGITADELDTFYKIIEQIKTNSGKLI
jgi:MarR family transcriptional regulator, transcriptional regulator for hemolysin